MRMLSKFKLSTITAIVICLSQSCINHKRLIKEEVVLNDSNSVTGTIFYTDSTKLKLKRIDESTTIVKWSDVDTIIGKKFSTFFLGFNTGIYNSPYFSVFRNESYPGSGAGMQLKLGWGLRGTKMYYFHYSYNSASPYNVKKFGLGFQRYVYGNYTTKRNCFFVGSDLNAMAIRYNNGLQFTFEPYSGFERKLNEQLRLHIKLGMQFNLANKNNQSGVNFSVGLHFLKKNYKKYYTSLNSNHRLPRK